MLDYYTIRDLPSLYVQKVNELCGLRVVPPRLVYRTKRYIGALLFLSVFPKGLHLR